MAFEPAQSAPTSSVPDLSAGSTGSQPTRDKVRLRFRKDGDLRLVSHRDLMKCFERMCRRAALPVITTQGYHPQPRIVFPLSLALGIVGLDEAVEIELEGRHDPKVVAAALARVAPPGLTILSARRIALKASGQARRVCFRTPLPPHHRAGLGGRIQSFLNAKECWFERTRPNRRRLNLRPFVRDLCLLEDTLEIDLWVTPTGTARPDEVLAVLGLADLLEEVVLARTLLELTDETPTPGEAPPLVASGEGRVRARSVSEGQV
ncbi:MAG: TIGR03936 family radical SAM-associated protein [Gemmataceae bacterium]|nr:TIGR03936 family radical SAM-associated protein [Gemmataceae bacterium]